MIKLIKDCPNKSSTWDPIPTSLLKRFPEHLAILITTLVPFLAVIKNCFICFTVEIFSILKNLLRLTTLQGKIDSGKDILTFYAFPLWTFGLTTRLENIRSIIYLYLQFCLQEGRRSTCFSLSKDNKREFALPSSYPDKNISRKKSFGPKIISQRLACLCQKIPIS